MKEITTRASRVTTNENKNCVNSQPITNPLYLFIFEFLTSGKKTIISTYIFTVKASPHSLIYTYADTFCF
ncbi:hypothetical protein Hanom_Chr09g00838051 [Helianthus anomalus]